MSKNSIGFAIKAKGLTHLEVARKIGVSRQAVQKWAAGVQSPTYDNLLRLSEVLGCSVDDLLGSDQPLKTPIQPTPEGETSSVIQVPLLDVYASAGGGVDPSLGETVCGIALSENFLRSLPGVTSIRKLHIIRVIGDSMEPTIEKNGYALVDGNQTRINADSIFCIQAENQIFVKRIQRNFDGSVELISDNPQYRPMKIDKADLENATIIGRVVFSFSMRQL